MPLNPMTRRPVHALARSHAVARLRAVAQLRRAGCGALATAIACITLAAQEPVLLRDPKTKDLFNSARIAIFGGPGGIARLQGLRFKGRSRFAGSGDDLISATVEIRVLLPDRFLRIDTGSFGRRQIGYAGDTSLDRMESATGHITPDSRSAAAVLQADRSELARLMLGTAMYASQEVPMKLQTRDTPIDMPGLPEALGIDATGETFAARIAFDGKSHLPVRIVFWSGDRTVRTSAFSDRRNVGGMQVPYAIVTTAGDRIVDELMFDEVTVNPPLTANDFRR
jgi:hypothetical protein